jgi:hypothetical protein
MPTVADVVDAVIAVDTHADSLAAALAAPTGVVLAQCEFPATAEGIEALIGWGLTLALVPSWRLRSRAPAATGSGCPGP